MKVKDIKNVFRTKFNLDLGCFNDLNKTKTQRRIKLTWVGTSGPDNLLHTRRDEFYDYFKNELGLNCEKYRWNGMCGCDTIVIRLEVK